MCLGPVAHGNMFYGCVGSGAFSGLANLLPGLSQKQLAAGCSGNSESQSRTKNREHPAHVSDASTDLG